MTVFAITFRITYDNEASYNKRYESLVDAIKASAGMYWDDPTSFFLITSDLTAPKLASHLVTTSYFDEEQDHLLVINLSATKGSAHRGKLIDQDLVPILKQR